MDKNSAKYAEPIWAVEVDEPRDGISFFSTALLMLGAGAAVVAVGVVVILIFSLEPAPTMPEAQHQRPFESNRELRNLTHPVAPKSATQTAAQ